MRALLLSVLLGAACSPTAMTLTPENPAHPEAQVGRLAGPPPALRPGVTESADAPPVSAPAVQHPPGHEMPEQGTAPPTEPHTMPMPAPPAAEKPAKPKQPVKKPAKPKQPAPKTPAPTGHEGHDMPKPADKPAPTGHEGHDMPMKPADRPADKPPAAKPSAPRPKPAPEKHTMPMSSEAHR